MAQAEFDIPRIFAARRFTPAVESAFGAHGKVTSNENDSILTEDELIMSAKGYDYLLVSVTERVSARVIQALAPRLKLIATLSVGTDHIDLAAARAAGIAVVTTPDVLTDACADLAWLLILGAARRGYEANLLLRSGTWAGWAPTQLLGVHVTGRRLGILGMGRIGRAVAARAAGFEMPVHYHNRSRLDPELERGSVYHYDAEALLAASDVLCICAPGGVLSGWLDERRLRLLPPGAIVVNVSRGDIVDDDALIDALADGHVFAAGLDVYAGEPAIDRRYATLTNAFLTPHIGSATTATRDAMGLLLMDGIRAFEAGVSAPNRII